ncbi:ATP-binding cassette domain-containing protein [Sapientia aquatica]|uniref:Probable ATP-binding protein YheS n=1 Tax=Sapientia aquatica TaxID=1549640 RepID=A0A4R5W835_9BURK|nr:ATP-binding cassette domain-containing protein [Sapientia aquatica]TDK68644.1 ATP-binding cassette domain-containing protein [Sapientia aquatica]
MIRFQQLYLMRGTKPLFEGVDLTLNPREKIGLIGSNGAGKSSLFAMLRNEIHSDQGSLDFPAQWQVAYVAQETPPLERSAIDYAIDGDTRLRKLEARLAELESQEATDENGNAIAEVYIALADADAYTVQSRAEQLLLGLGFTMAQMTQSVASFSGGWRMRLNLAQALMCPSDLLLLDEPTNHLDLDAIIWLEEWLKRYAGTLVIISHDRDFLDGVVNVIVHIDERKLKRYGGNYSSFERQRLAQLELAQGMIEKQNRQRAHLQSFIDRFKAKASKAKQAQSRVKALARMDELAPLRAAAEFSFEFKEPLNAPNPLLVMEDVSAGYYLDEYDKSQTKIIVDNINFSLQIGQRIGLLGVNGAGKSTLIKTIAGELNPVNGVSHLGKGLTIGYFAQHQVEMLRHDESPLWHMVKIAPTVREQELRNFLGSFNFPGNMVTSPIKPFSGGEKARLALALIVWQRPNLLLLDEPTNHLDLETREALTDALAQFEGTVVLVSHDRHLLRATTDQFIIVADGELKPFDGDLDDYKDWLLQNKLATAEASKNALAAKVEVKAEPVAETKPAKPTTLNPTQKKALETKIQRLDGEIEQFNAELAEIASKLADSDIYDDKRKHQLKTLLASQTKLQGRLEVAEAEWLSLNEQLEA